MKKHFQLTKEEWEQIKKLSSRARNTPVMATSIGEGMAGNDFASEAYRAVYQLWGKLGKKYGFDSNDVKPVNELERTIIAKVID